MDRLRFEESVEEHFKACVEILREKGGDYTGDEDVFASLRRNAETLGLTVEQLILAFFQKHVDAITTGIRDGKLRSEKLDSRILDATNYLILLRVWLANSVQEVKVTRPDLPIGTDTLR